MVRGYSIFMTLLNCYDSLWINYLATKCKNCGNLALANGKLCGQIGCD